MVRFVFIGVVFLTPFTGAAFATVDRIVETFESGDFENPGWQINADGVVEDGGFSFVTMSDDEDPIETGLFRDISGRGTFSSRAEFRNLDLGSLDSFSPASSQGGVSLRHVLGSNSDDFIGVSISETRDESPVWRFVSQAGRSGDARTIPRSDHLAVEIAFDSLTSVVMFTYQDINDADASVEFEFEYTGEIAPTHELGMRFVAGGPGKANGILERYDLIPVPKIPGDFNGNELLDVEDIDLLSQQVRDETNDPIYDLNDDDLVNEADRTVWVKDLKQAFFGDANFNGEFNSSDLVLVFGVGEYEYDIALNSTWAGGDWNGDGDFTSSDLVTAFQDGGYEQGVAVVPEPAALVLLLGLLGGAFMRKHQRCR